MNPSSGAVARRYHELTNHLVDNRESTGPSGHPPGFRSMDPANRPAPFKRYPSAPRMELPAEVGSSGIPAAQVLSGSAAPAREDFDAAMLGRLLYYCAGVTRVRTTGEGRQLIFRAAPAAGNLHPVEVYISITGGGGLPDGLHHFAPGGFALETLRAGDRSAVVAEALADPVVADAVATVVLTGVPWRTGWKYTARGLRHVYWDAGSLLAQLLAVADAAGLQTTLRLGFDDGLLNEELGIDGISEFPVAVVTIGTAVGCGGASTAGADLLAGEPEPTSPNPLEFPAVTEMQSAGNLSGAEEVRAWRAVAAGLGRQPGDTVSGAPAESVADIEEVVRRRGSTRLFRREPINKAIAEWCLGVASRPVNGDFCQPGASLLSHQVSIHGVEGVDPGRYEWSGSTLQFRTAMKGEDDARDEAIRLCLGQPLGGDSALTAFHCADLEGVLGALGARGYRAAQLEAGLAAGRLQLAAFCAGLGGTGLTFFDDLVPGAFATADACMLVTAVGPSDYRNTPGGTPRSPTELAKMDGLMRRFSARFRGAS